MLLMKYDPRNAHYIAVTGIIHKRGKYLIVKRAAHDKIFPNRWKVPGGKLEDSDYLNRKPDEIEETGPVWYNMAERVLEREIKEEVGIKIKNFKYITSLIFIRPDKIPTLVISLAAQYASGKIKLEKDLSEFAWVNLKEAKKYDLIAGIYEEIEMAEDVLNGKKIGTWKKK